MCPALHVAARLRFPEDFISSHVQDVLFAGPKPQPPLKHLGRGAQYVAFVSGLHIGDEASNPARISMLLEFLTGMLGSSPEQTTSSQVPALANSLLPSYCTSRTLSTVQRQLAL